MARLNNRIDPPETIDLLRRKLGAQNRAIAKSHANLQERINQLEAQIQQLSEDNFLLRAENIRINKQHADDLTAHYSHLRELLREKWLEVDAAMDSALEQGLSDVQLSRQEPATNLSESSRVRRITTRKKSEIDSREVNEFCIPEETEDEVRQAARVHFDMPREPAEKVSNSTVSAEMMLDTTSSDASQVFSEDVADVIALEESADSPAAEELLAAEPETSVVIMSEPVEKPAAPAVCNDELRTPSKISKPKQHGRTPLATKTGNPHKKAPKELEVLPTESPPRRRSRGGQVNYALPSLRTKMRRENKKFVDAVLSDKENAVPFEGKKRLSSEMEMPAAKRLKSVSP